MRNWLNSNWLELVITILVAVIDVALITPWIVLLVVSTGGDGLHLAVPIGLAVIGVGSFWIARELLTRTWDMAAMRMVSLGIWLVMIIVWYGIVSGAWLAAPFRFVDQLFQFDGLAFGLLILGGLGWWRGIWLASTEEIFESDFIRAAVMRTVVFQALILVVAAILWDSAASPIFSYAIIMVPLGFAACLVAATAIQVKSARGNISQEADQRQPGTGWLGAGAAIAGVILVVSGIIAGTAGREIWHTLLWPFIQVLRGLNWLLDWVILGVALIGYLIMLPIFWVVQQLVDRPQEDHVQEFADDPVLEPAEEVTGTDAIPEIVLLVIQWVLVVAIIVFVIWFALRQLKRMQNRQREASEVEVRESMWSSATLMDDLSGMLRGLRGRLWSRQSRINLRRAPETVRDAYQYTLVHAGRQGIHRDRSESPLTYSSRLKSTDPDVGDPIDDLTERYMRARYGDLTSDEDIRIAREDWEAIRQRLRRQQQEE